jgi:hypothetical protein
MLSSQEHELLVSLNERIQTEADSRKLMRLIEQLNDLLYKAEARVNATRAGKGVGAS